MKLIPYILMFFILFLTSCSDQLDTAPTDKTTKDEVFSTVEGSFAALNGIYRSLYKSDTEWSQSYGTENFGIASVNLAADLMGEDMGMGAQGSSWFWYDYRYWVREEINNKSDRPYVWWNMFYKTINNVNNIIAYAPAAEGSPEDKNNVLGQAYALRAYAYFMLIQYYQRTYVGHENDPGVPVYTEPTTKESEGKGRGTVEQVYERINTDLDEAIRLFNIGSPQRHKSHIDKYVAHGLKSRVALVQNHWQDAADHANAARQKEALNLMGAGDLLGGFNTVANSEWMWGAEINEDQSTSWYSFFNHMDADAGGHAKTAWKIVGNWIYDQIGENDVRKSWFRGYINPEGEYPSAGTPSNRSYVQLKFRVKSQGSWASDYIYMRKAEMYLNEAEALCQLGLYDDAKGLLRELIGYKDPDYESRLVSLANDKTLNLKSTGAISTLMDEIILQRRIELWGEGFRIYDIMRLKTGVSRNWSGSNHPVSLEISDPDSWDWIMMIPQMEFDGNINMDPGNDQNP